MVGGWKINEPIPNWCIGTSIGEAVLIEHFSEKLWYSRIERLEWPLPWKDAGAIWQAVFRERAVTSRQALPED